MGITIQSYPRAIQRRNTQHRKKAIINNTYRRYDSTKRPCKYIRSQEDINEKTVALEEHLNELQERIYMTRQYIRCIRHEYSGSSREAIDHYVKTIDDMYMRVATCYIRNIRESFPILKEFLSQIEEEFANLITEGGFTEAEAYDYIYGNDLPDGPDISDTEADADNTDADDTDIVNVMTALIIT
jgi:hypothetical protein